MAKGIALVLFVIAYIVVLLVIVFALSNIAHKAVEEGKRPTLSSTTAAMILLFFGAFLFAKFLFGF